MNQKTIVWALPLLFLFILIGSGFTLKKTFQTLNPEDNIVIPENIQAIIDHSCFGCHNVDSQSDKAKKKLLFDELAQLPKAKIVAKLGDISEMVGKGEMPPEKFLEKFPDKALSEEQAKTLKDWADNAAEELLK